LSFFGYWSKWECFSSFLAGFYSGAGFFNICLLSSTFFIWVSTSLAFALRAGSFLGYSGSIFFTALPDGSLTISAGDSFLASGFSTDKGGSSSVLSALIKSNSLLICYF
jgi:ABC-type uncharacterized transport system permease subunit